MSQSRIQVYQYFQTGDIPTESQFQFLFNNLWFKDEQMSISDVSGLAEMFQNTLSVEQLENHTDDENAHIQFLAKLDGSNIDVEAWKTLLEIIKIATVDDGDFEGNVYTKEQIQATINELLVNIDGIRDILNSNDVNLDELQEIVNYIKENREQIELLQELIIGETTDTKVNLTDDYDFLGIFDNQRDLNRSIYDFLQTLSTEQNSYVKSVTSSESFPHPLGTDKLIIQCRDSVTGKRIECEDYATSTTIQINFLTDIINPINVLITKINP